MRLGEIERIHTVKPLFEPIPLEEPAEPSYQPEEQPAQVEEPAHQEVGA